MKKLHTVIPNKASRVLLLLAVLITTTAMAQWPALPAPNIPLGVSPGNEHNYWAAPDEVGGAYAVWEDDRLADNDIYVQRISKNGVVMWTVNGETIAVLAGHQHGPKICNNQAGAAIMAWKDDRRGNDDIYAQMIDSNGVVAWAANGIPICGASGKQDKVEIIADGTGGAIIAWVDERSANKDIYAQRVNAAGVIQWVLNGVAVCANGSDQDKLKMVSDGAGGAIITWADGRGVGDIYAQRISGAGAVAWTADGEVISSAADAQTEPSITIDGASGAIISWQDKRTGTEDIYAQLIDAAGAVQWTANGVVISTAINKQTIPEVVSDSAGGAMITWIDKRSGQEDVYAQRVNSAGTVQWAANGVVVCIAAGTQKRVHMTSANWARAFIIWEDDRTGTEDLYVQILDGTGAALLVADGLVVCNATDKQTKPFIFSNNNGQWISLWTDERNGNKDLYAQGYNKDIISVLPIELLSFTAHVNGNQVDLAWATASEKNNDYFTIEKSRDGQHFEEVLRATGAGNSSSIIEYMDVDYNPWEGISYYRLKQTDFDGKFAYSGIVPVEYNKNGKTGLTIFPNPSDGVNVFITLDGMKDKEVLVVLRDITGAEVHSKVIITNTDHVITALDPQGKLAAGTYLVTASSENILYSKKLLIE